MASTSQAANIDGNNVARKAGKCGELAAEIPAHSQNFENPRENKQNTFVEKLVEAVTPEHLKGLERINNKLEKINQLQSPEFNKDCATLPPAPAAAKP